jgi:hypothetical protein
MERRKHFWNGGMGRLVRHDVYVYEDAATWWVEARQGGGDGESRWFELPGEYVALTARGISSPRRRWTAGRSCP